MLSIFSRGGLLNVTSPLGLVATGIAIGALTPTIGKTARSMGVLAIRGALMMTDSVMSLGNKMSQEMSTMMKDAKTTKSSAASNNEINHSDYTTQLNDVPSYELQSYAEETKTL